MSFGIKIQAADYAAAQRVIADQSNKVINMQNVYDGVRTMNAKEKYNGGFETSSVTNAISKWNATPSTTQGTRKIRDRTQSVYTLEDGFRNEISAADALDLLKQYPDVMPVRDNPTARAALDAATNYRQAEAIIQRFYDPAFKAFDRERTADPEGEYYEEFKARTDRVRTAVQRRKTDVIDLDSIGKMREDVRHIVIRLGDYTAARAIKSSSKSVKLTDDQKEINKKIKILHLARADYTRGQIVDLSRVTYQSEPRAAPTIRTTKAPVSALAPSRPASSPINRLPLQPSPPRNRFQVPLRPTQVPAAQNLVRSPPPPPFQSTQPPAFQSTQPPAPFQSTQPPAFQTLPPAFQQPPAPFQQPLEEVDEEREMAPMDFGQDFGEVQYEPRGSPPQIPSTSPRRSQPLSPRGTLPRSPSEQPRAITE